MFYRDAVIAYVTEQIRGRTMTGGGGSFGFIVELVPHYRAKVRSSDVQITKRSLLLRLLSDGEIPPSDMGEPLKALARFLNAVIHRWPIWGRRIFGT